MLTTITRKLKTRQHKIETSEQETEVFFSGAKRKTWAERQFPELCLSFLFFCLFSSTGCPNMFGIGSEVCERSEHRLRKIVFCSKKLCFQPYLWTARNENGFFSNFSPIVLCSNLFSELFEIGKSCFKNPLLFFAVHKKGLKHIFLERNKIFSYVMLASLAMLNETFSVIFKHCVRKNSNFNCLKVFRGCTRPVLCLPHFFARLYVSCCFCIVRG